MNRGIVTVIGADRVVPGDLLLIGSVLGTSPEPVLSIHGYGTLQFFTPTGAHQVHSDEKVLVIRA